MKAALACIALAAFLPAQTPAPKYEMANYIVGFLVRPPGAPAKTPEESKRIQEGHMSHIRKMADSGKLIVAGPFTDDGDLRGMLIFKDVTIEEARKMVDGDPAVQAGRLAVRLHPWFAGKGLNVPPPSK